MTNYNDLPIEGHTVKRFRCHLSLERHSFSIECITKANKRLLIEFASEGPGYLLKKLADAFEENPQMRGWQSPTKH